MSNTSDQESSPPSTTPADGGRVVRYRPLQQLLLARLREFTREPAAIFWVYVFPLLLVLALGVAFRNQRVETLTVDVVQTPNAEQLATALSGDERLTARVVQQQQWPARLRTGETDLVVQPSENSDAQYEYVFDPTRPNGLLARNTVDDVLQRQAGRTDVVVTRNQEFSEPGGRYIDFLIPGMLGMGLMGGGLWGVGFAIVDMRIRKLLKRFLATPMKRTHFLIAVMISRFLFMVPEVVLLLLFARLAFGVVIHGNLAVILLLIVLGAFQFSGIGLLVASRAGTLETVSGLMNLVMLPMWLGSGMFFSIERFPESVQPALRLLPLTPLISALRAVMLEAAPLSSLGMELALIVGWGMITLVLAIWLFRWN